MHFWRGFFVRATFDANVVEVSNLDDVSSPFNVPLSILRIF
jgi:hypothetical protein